MTTTLGRGTSDGLDADVDQECQPPRGGRLTRARRWLRRPIVIIPFVLVVAAAIWWLVHSSSSSSSAQSGPVQRVVAVTALCVVCIVVLHL